MLRQIDVAHLEIGMFVHKMGGSWLSHPFWKSRFPLQDEKQLTELQSSSVPWVVIDTDKGIDLLTAVEAPAPVPTAAADNADDQAEEEAPRSRRAGILERARENESAFVVRKQARAAIPSLGPLHQEIGRAGAVAFQARQVMRDCYTEVRLGRAVDVATVVPMVDDIMASIQRHPHAFNGIMRLMKTSDYLHAHALAVSGLMIGLATQLRLPLASVREAGLAGLLMDMGMGHVPSEIYDKASPLNPAERTIMHGHTTLAHDFLGIEGNISEAVLDVCLHHHERMDGSGYPHGLMGEDISLFARMAAICDSYEAMTSPRVYRQGGEPASVIEWMQQSPALFDQEIFDAFVRAIGIYPVGSLVRLRSDRLAMVLDQNPKNPVLPKVQLFFSVAEQRRITPETLDLVYCIGRDDIMGRENPADWGFEDWDVVSGSLWENAMGLARA